jgi:hypothetical protein
VALYYSGTMRTASVATVTPTTNMSMGCWMRHGNAFSGTMRVYDGSRHVLLPSGAADDVNWQREWTTIGEWVVTLASNGINKSKWFFYGVTYDGGAVGNDPIIYVAQEGATALTVATQGLKTAPTGTIVNTAATLNVGNRTDGARPFLGEVAWVTVYDAILTAAQMLNVAVNGYITTNLLRGYELISTSGAGLENDLSANNGDATGTNTPLRVPEPLRMLPAVKNPGTGLIQFPKSKLRRAT